MVDLPGSPARSPATGRHRLPLLLGVCAVLAAGCTATPAPPPVPLGPPAAEPAASPPLTTPPAGRVVPVGMAPEGVVADPVTHLVAVGVREPDVLALVDARTGDLVRRVPLPGHLRHLQLAKPGGPVLVPDENSDALLTVALPGGDITSRVHTGTSPHDATEAADGSIFAANEGGSTVAVIRNGAVVHTFTDATQPAGLAPVGTVVGLVDVRQDNLHLYDAASLTPITTLPAGAGPTHVVADIHGHLVVIDTRGNAVLLDEFGPHPRQIGRLDLPGTPYGVTYDPVRDRVWVALTATNEVVEIDASSGQPHVVRRLPTVRQPNTVGVDSATGRLFVTGTADGVLELIDP